MLFRYMIALAAEFVAAALVGKLYVPWLRKVKAGQEIREVGPNWHKTKAGTPTMGGVIFIAAVFVNLIRGVPMIVLAYFIFFGVPYFWNTILGIGGLTLTALQAGSICLALNCGAYMAEIIRAGIESVDVGQMEAARSLGLPWWRSMYRVVMPQAIRTMIPSIINQFIITLKDTSILSVIGFPELVNTAKNVVAATFMSFQTWAIVGLMYLIVILLLQRAAKVLEGRLKYGA